MYGMDWCCAWNFQSTVIVLFAYYLVGGWDSNVTLTCGCMENCHLSINYVIINPYFKSDMVIYAKYFQITWNVLLTFFHFGGWYLNVLWMVWTIRMTYGCTEHYQLLKNNIIIDPILNPIHIHVWHGLESSWYCNIGYLL